jgi:hypothetical protein
MATMHERPEDSCLSWMRDGGHNTAVRLTPDETRNLTIELVGELAAILALGDKQNGPDHEDRGRSPTMVAGARFELTTFRL